MDANARSINIVSWNVRGLNDPDKCSIVKDTLATGAASIICLQETKLNRTNDAKTRAFLPPRFTNYS